MVIEIREYKCYFCRRGHLDYVKASLCESRHTQEMSIETWV